MFKNRNRIVIVVALLVLILSTPAWANSLAKAAYDARLAEGGKNAASRAKAIERAVANDKTGNPAQAAYNARINEKDVDRRAPNNPADKIYQAVLKEQNRLAEQASQAAAKLNSKESSSALDTIEKVLSKIPETRATKPATNTAKIIDAFQIARGMKDLVKTSQRYRNASGAEKDKLSGELAIQNLNLIARAGGQLGSIQSSLVQVAVAGAVNLVKLNTYRHQTNDLILAGLDQYIDSEYRSMVVALMKNKVSKQEINQAVAAFETLKKIR